MTSAEPSQKLLRIKTMDEDLTISKEESFVSQHRYVLQWYSDVGCKWIPKYGFDKLDDAMVWLENDSPNILRDRRILIGALHCYLYYTA
jgi:hypothetical protein